MFRSIVSRVVDAFVPDHVLCSMYLDAFHENGRVTTKSFKEAMSNAIDREEIILP